jgi:integral membrane protein
LEVLVLSTKIGRLRVCGWAEGVSFLLLLGVAMPLKYLMDIPMAVRIVGLIHGVLFLMYVAGLVTMQRELNWPRKILFGGILAALLPFGPFVFERHLPKGDGERD